MADGTIIAKTVRAMPDGSAVEVMATLDAGEVHPGMFVHIPLNGSLDFTARIIAVSPIA